MAEELEELCFGHWVHKTKQCEKCFADLFNKRCPNYQPLYILRYEVVGEASLDNETLSCEDVEYGN